MSEPPGPAAGMAGAAAVVGALADPAVIVDLSATVVVSNAAARTAWPALLPGRPLAFALRTPDVVAAVAAVLAGDGMREGTHAERVPVERLWSFRIAPLPLGPGPDHALVVLHDLTAARRLERMRVDFIANASHELRTPLASLLGFVETLQGPGRDDPVARERFLPIMRDQARRMARLIDDLLSLSRVELQEHRRPDTRVDVTSVAREMIDTLRPLSQERGVSVDLVAEGPAVVFGDRDELLRLAENLIENAVKYGRSGRRVEVRVSTDDQPGDGPCARVAVRDWGPGIAAEHIPRLTERFYRVDDTDKGGTGLGLALVKHILNRHRGRLAVTSRPGEGSTFTAVLPLAPREDGAAAPL